jgi:hypothetical protein
VDKKNIIISAIVSIALLVSVILVMNKNSKPEEISITKAVPLNTKLLIKINDIYSLHKSINKNCKIFQSLKNVSGLKPIFTNSNFIDTILDSENAELLHGLKQVAISIDLITKNNYSALFIIPNIASESNCIDEIETIVDEKYRLKEYKYEKAIIYEVINKNDNTLSYFSIFKNFLLISKSNLHIESSIRQLNSEFNIANDKSFKKLKKSAGKNSDLNIYINHKEFPKLLSLFVNYRFKELVNNYHSLSDWSEFDVDINEESIYLNGLSDFIANQKNYFHIQKNQDNQKIEIQNILPSTTSFFHLSLWEDFKKYYTNYIKYLNNNLYINKYNRHRYQIKRKTDIDIEKLIFNLADNQVANVFCNNGSSSLVQSNYFVMKLKSQNIAHNQIRELISKYCTENKINKRDYIGYYRFDNEIQHPIYKLPFTGLGKLFFGEFNGINNQQYCSFYNNYMILGQSKQSVSYFLKMNFLNSTLNNDAEFQTIQKFYSEKANIHTYINPKKALSVIRYFFDNNFVNKYEQNVNHINKIQSINYQAKAESDIIFQSLSINYNSKFSSNESRATLWESILTADIVSKPKFVMNHNTYENEVIVQDSKNNIYLINKAGRVLWTRKVDSEIIGKIHQIDIYKNKKLQYIFNTKSKIYLIDRNGNYVKNFPISLPSEATNPMNIFDYDKSRDYRFVVATEDKKILMYNNKGSIVRGWDFKRSESIIKSPIEHFRIYNKDFIVCSDKNRVYLLNRKGHIRVKVLQTISKAKHSEFSLVKNKSLNSSKLIFTDVFGNVINLFFNGKVTRDKMELFSRNHHFKYASIDNTAGKDFVYGDDNVLSLYNQNQERVFQKEFEADIINISTFSFSESNKKIGILTSDNKIYLVNADGSTESSFPIKAISPFSIGRFTNSSKAYSIVVGGENGKLNNYEYELSEE